MGDEARAEALLRWRRGYAGFLLDERGLCSRHLVTVIFVLGIVTVRVYARHVQTESSRTNTYKKREELRSEGEKRMKTNESDTSTPERAWVVFRTL